ncbi:MAG: LytR/AlgR family response regulator transcription factor [Gemmatimonadales bacterium]
MQPIRTLIVDDEPAAREGMRHLLSGDPDIVIAGECANGREAAETIVAAAPDLVFLDVQMPELDGFGVLREVPREQLPAIIFVTAYDQYAIRAFEVHALDYLLKPFTDERFRESLGRAKQHLGQGRAGELSRRLATLLDQYLAPPSLPAGLSGGKYLERLVIKSGGRVTLLRVGEIEWIDADGDYARIHVGKAWHLLRETMKNLEAQLDPARFVRIHRSTIVNLEKVKELQPFFRGEYVVVLHTGVTLKLSRGYREHLEVKLGRRF